MDFSFEKTIVKIDDVTIENVDIILTFKTHNKYANAIKGYAQSDMISYGLTVDNSDIQTNSNIIFIEAIKNILYTIPLPYSYKEDKNTYKIDEKNNDRYMEITTKNMTPPSPLRSKGEETYITALGLNESLKINNIKLAKRKEFDIPYLTKFIIDENSLKMRIIRYENEQIAKQMIYDIINSLINKFIELEKIIKNKETNLYGNYIKSDSYINLSFKDREYIKALLIKELDNLLPSFPFSSQSEEKGKEKGMTFENKSNPDDDNIHIKINGNGNKIEKILINSINNIIETFRSFIV